jgi:hypothetical protein
MYYLIPICYINNLFREKRFSSFYDYLSKLLVIFYCFYYIVFYHLLLLSSITIYHLSNTLIITYKSHIVAEIKELKLRAIYGNFSRYNKINGGKVIKKSLYLTVTSHLQTDSIKRSRFIAEKNK